jgi:hypothetical protein
VARFGRTVAFFNDDMSTPAKALQTILTAPIKALVQLVAGSDAPVSHSFCLTAAAAAAAAAASTEHELPAFFDTAGACQQGRTICNQSCLGMR